MRFVYTVLIYGYGLLIALASIFNSKAKKWIKGRENWATNLDKAKGRDKVNWFHFASLGEFEQGRPIMEKLKLEDPEIFLLITFFSPSGFEIRKKYALGDLICYLPLDTPSNASKFLEGLKLERVFFIKYEFWFNFLNQLQKRNIPTYLISGIFREKQHFFKWYGGWFRRNLSVFKHFFVQNQESLILLNKIGFKNATYSGDTRFDRVIDIAKSPKRIPEIEGLIQDRQVFIIGSNWPADDEILIPFINEQLSHFLFVIAPHNMSKKQFENIERGIKGTVLRISHMPSESKTANVLLIDSIGYLSSIYQYGNFAYIGGGFGKNVHNVLEAAVYGIPCIFGPNFEKFQECHDLLALEAAYTVASTEELNKQMNQLLVDNAAANAGKRAADYVQKNSGATEKVIYYLLN